MRRLLFLPCIMLGCANAGAPSVPPPGPATAVSEAPDAPLNARWKLISDSGGVLRIAAIVELRAVLPAPVDVTVEVPPGLQLQSGQPAFQVPPDAGPSETERQLEFTYSQAPVTDLKLVAQLRSGGMGIRATDAYRFGRAAPRPNQPQPSGSSVKFGDADLGQPIQLDSSNIKARPVNAEPLKPANPRK